VHKTKNLHSNAVKILVGLLEKGVENQGEHTEKEYMCNVRKMKFQGESAKTS
jgi:hypothetical protein